MIILLPLRTVEKFIKKKNSETDQDGKISQSICNNGLSREADSGTLPQTMGATSRHLASFDDPYMCKSLTEYNFV